ncbi:inorganic phosphate transporter [Flavobacterium sp. '19STA2R22 D10 B1']|uniref:inorganic phosphate transporter n=1 Tax=Flavobacterium aerium TaxID=3037261 RepID=UPI00278BEEF8|nr:inorganic phosphate transporter [Flavobacterium sp. '19STA2R22 D10 B1']
MEQVYVLMLLALVILAVIDLSVGVANDAVNFLNSAIGSKAVSFKMIMIVASIGVAVGATFSGGMMEIARSGIFVPSLFSFNDVMIIFMAVMITDILLLDVFNSLGLPTSTTVSVIFSLLGASVCLAIFKIVKEEDSMDLLSAYINTKKASEIVYSILLSVLLSFSIGAVVQYIARIIFTFQIEKRMRYVGAIFGGLAISAITFFIIFKGLKDASFVNAEMKVWLNSHQLTIIGVNLIFWTIASQLIMTVFKTNIFRVIIVIGTFALALAFAGNDLVNFIGVPIAAWQSYGIYTAAGGVDDTMLMGALASGEMVAPFYLLLLAGIVMIFTLWTSKKARNVIETEMSLTRQGEGVEKFAPNTLSRIIVRGTMYIGIGVNYFLPKSLQLKIDKRFEKIETLGKSVDEPVFDMVRASVNLMVASILIAIGTSMKLPLSTTYVTFMVAMGSSFADRAWDRESAVYRVAGVFNVIGGWFVTAIIAFLSSALIASIMHFGKVVGLVALLILVAILLFKSAKAHAKKVKREEDRVKLKREDIVTIHEVIQESSNQISNVISNSNKLYSDVIDNLGLQDLAKLNKNKKQLKKIEKEVDELKSNVYYFIRNLDETSLEGSKFYVLILGYLQDMVQSIGYITQNSFVHVDNNHKKLKFNQIRDLKSIDNELSNLFDTLEDTFESKKFEKIEGILAQKNLLLDNVSILIQKQITRIRTTETSPKNSKLYFALLLETNDLIKATMNLLELFKEFNAHVNSSRK